MSQRSVARRYATALFDVTRTAGDLDRLDRELREFSALVDGHSGLRHALESPALPAANKGAIVEQVLAGGDVSAEIRRLLLMLAERGRLSLLREIVTAFADRILAHRQIVQADVVTAAAIPDGKRAALVHALSRAAGADVRLRERVDPAIVGGVVARVGSVVFDGSVTRQLEKMRERLLGQVS